MAYAKDFDGLLADSEEQDTVVAEAEAEFSAWRLKLDDVASTGFEVMVDCLQYLPSRLTVDSAQLTTGHGGPDDNPLGHRSGLVR
jgi:hypothetical protein